MKKSFKKGQTIEYRISFWEDEKYLLLNRGIITKVIAEPFSTVAVLKVYSFEEKGLITITEMRVRRIIC